MVLDAFGRRQQSIAQTTAAGAKRIFAQGMTDSFDASWAAIRPQMIDLVQAGRLAAATLATGYVAQALQETGQPDAPAAGDIVPARFVESAPDGRDIGTLLDQAPIYAKAAIAQGRVVPDALATASTWLVGTVLTVSADTSRAVIGADIVARPRVAGYVRQLSPPSCERCVILAGKWYRWNTGFQRHPRCDCRHIPASEDIAGDFTTDPYAYFSSLTKEEQYKRFGRSEARAINEGGDIYRVMNVKTRGLGTAKGAARFGTPTRLTVDDIYRVAGTRTNAVRLLAENGFITGPQTREGNIIGRFRNAYSGGISRAVAGSNRQRVIASRVSGIRDPLDRATMTAAERRLFDAQYRLEYARMTGRLPEQIVNPRGLHGSSADVSSSFQGVKATPQILSGLERDLEQQISTIAADERRGVDVAQRLRIADSLGIRARVDRALGILR